MNVTKVRSHVMLILHNVRIVPSNVRKKKREPLYVTSTVTCDIGTAQYEDDTIKCKKKNKGTTECDKRIVTCDIGTTQCEDRTVKCEKKVKKPPNVRK